MRGTGRRNRGRGIGKRQRGPRRRIGRGKGCLLPNAGGVTVYGPSSRFLPTAFKDMKPFQRTYPLVATTDADKCVACGTCQEVCPEGAIRVEEIARVDPNICVGCGSCVDNCPQGALSLGPPGMVRKKRLESTR